jgi:hypothetical protein
MWLSLGIVGLNKSVVGLEESRVVVWGEVVLEDEIDVFLGSFLVWILVLELFKDLDGEVSNSESFLVQTDRKKFSQGVTFCVCQGWWLGELWGFCLC